MIFSNPDCLSFGGNLPASMSYEGLPLPTAYTTATRRASSSQIAATAASSTITTGREAATPAAGGTAVAAAGTRIASKQTCRQLNRQLNGQLNSQLNSIPCIRPKAALSRATAAIVNQPLDWQHGQTSTTILMDKRLRDNHGNLVPYRPPYRLRDHLPFRLSWSLFHQNLDYNPIRCEAHPVWIIQLGIIHQL